MKNNIDKLGLLKEICDFYGFEMAVLGDKDSPKYVVDNGTSSGVKFLGTGRKTVEKDFTHFEYDSLDVALKDWLSTLVESNAASKDDSGEYGVWSKEVIDFISQLGPIYPVGSEIIARRNFPEPDENTEEETSYDVKAGEKLKVVEYDKDNVEYKVENSSLGSSAWFLISEADLLNISL